jgi:hypothetical protein
MITATGLYNLEPVIFTVSLLHRSYERVKSFSKFRLSSVPASPYRSDIDLS